MTGATVTPGFVVAWPVAFLVLLAVAPIGGRTVTVARRRLPDRLVPVLFAVLLSGLMTSIISGISIARVLGVTAAFAG